LVSCNQFEVAGSPTHDAQRLRVGDVAAFENHRPVTEAKFINKSSLSILLLGFIRRLKPKLNSKKKVENIFVARHIAKPNVELNLR